MTSQSESRPWWQTGVIYQIYPRSFKDSNGDGIGDLQGIIDKLDFLNDGTSDSLGIDAIWISPIYPSPMADFGYDITDYRDIHPIFGDLPTFDRLLDEAHRRNIRVLLDFVPNHTSDEHPWFIDSRASRQSPKRDWYIWRDALPDGGPPNNWASMFGGTAWAWDEKTQQYYLHLFLDKQPDLNWRNPAVKEAMLNVLRFWLDRGVDGFRIDVVGYLLKDAKLRDNPVLGDSTSASNSDHDLWARQEHLFDIDQSGVHDIIRQFRQLHDSYGERVIIGEVWASPRSRWAQYYGRKLDGLHLAHNFELIHVPWEAGRMKHSVDELESTLPEGAWPTYVLGSHDVPRLATRYGPESVRVAAMMLLTLRGTPTLYMGDEIGMIDAVIEPQQLQDPQGLQLGVARSRDGCRSPYQWSAEPNAGFSDGTPWLPIAPAYATRNVERQTVDTTSILALYKRLLRYRRDNSALNCGAYLPVEALNDECFVYVRECLSERRLIALNFGDKTLHLDVSDQAPTGEIVISTLLDRSEFVTLDNLTLRPHEGIIIEL